MKSYHTPGPWRVTSPERDPNAYDVESCEGVKITRGYWGGAACADAKLIVAAPELLEAAKYALVFTGMRAYDAYQASQIREKCDEALRTAIAKAEGR